MSRVAVAEWIVAACLALPAAVADPPPVPAAPDFPCTCQQSVVRVAADGTLHAGADAPPGAKEIRVLTGVKVRGGREATADVVLATDLPYSFLPAKAVAAADARV